MATTFLNEENMRDIIWGATLMGGGGGGSISSGMMLLESYKKEPSRRNSEGRDDRCR